MIILIAGASHTGKTLLAQKLMERYHYPYLSIDHVKMGLIRSGMTALTPEDDEELTDYLWPIVREIVKTAIENGQNLIVEGCYIPFDWTDGFGAEYLAEIRYICLVMSENYIREHADEIRRYASVVEKRLAGDTVDPEALIADNANVLEEVKRRGLPHILIDKSYEVDYCL